MEHVGVPNECEPYAIRQDSPGAVLVMSMDGRMTLGEQLYVITGCSGSGKSTLIAALAAAGESTCPEPGRRIVKQQLEIGGDALPWDNAQRFVDACAAQAVADFDYHCSGPRRVFFDRSFVDVAAAVARSGLRASDALTAALSSRRYAPLAFMSAPWEALFGRDAERRHTFADAVAEYESLVPSYRALGYQLIFLPRAATAECMAFVKRALSDHASGRR